MVLEVDYNQLTSFPDLTFCQHSIEVVTACCNLITSIDLSVLSSLPKLTYLDLHENELIHVTPLQIGQSLPQIAMIDVSSNHLSSFPQLYQQTVSPSYPDLVIYLSDNPLECGSCLTWLKHCPYNIVTDKDDAIVCATPPQFVGRTFDSVLFTELNSYECVEFANDTESSTTAINEENINCQHQQNTGIISRVITMVKR